MTDAGRKTYKQSLKDKTVGRTAIRIGNWQSEIGNIPKPATGGLRKTLLFYGRRGAA